MKHVLITGGAGFIGSHLCEKFLKEDYIVTCIDALYAGSEKNIAHLSSNPAFKFIKEDILKYDFSNLEKIDLLLHFASRAAPDEYQEEPIHTIETNSFGTVKMLEIAKQHNAVFILASTSEIYGDTNVIPTPETHYGYVNTVGPRSCYDESKRFGEAVTFAYSQQYKMDARIIRIFNTYGPRIRHDGMYGRAIPRFISQAINGESITVYDGSQTRSFCYIDDTVSAIFRISTDDRAGGQIFNAGNPQEIRIIGLANLIKELTGSNSEILLRPLPKDDPRRRCPDINKIKSVLNWEPKISLDDGLAKTIKWFREEFKK